MSHFFSKLNYQNQNGKTQRFLFWNRMTYNGIMQNKRKTGIFIAPGRKP